MVRVLGTAALVLAAFSAQALIDPHDEGDPRRCGSCHTPAIRTQPVRDGEYHLLTETVDGVCLVCHRKEECCRVGQEHQDRRLQPGIGITHPSDLPVAEVPAAQRPRTLPVFGGRITCNTCHYHDRRRPADYKLVRLVVIRNTGVDWTHLCADCHDGY